MAKARRHASQTGFGESAADILQTQQTQNRDGLSEIKEQRHTGSLQAERSFGRQGADLTKGATYLDIDNYCPPPHVPYVIQGRGWGGLDLDV